jgi:hypothetical protein
MATIKIDTSKLTRFEVINQTGRVYTQMPCKVELSVQDGGKTLKVFTTPMVE